MKIPTNQNIEFIKGVTNEKSIRDIQVTLKKEQRSLLVKRIRSNRLTMLGLIIILIATSIALLAPLITTHTPYEFNPADRLMPPSSDFILGTDNFGRDLFTRLVYGIRVSLTVGFAVTILSSLLGMIVGLYSAYYRTLDHILMRICDGLMAFPGILLAISIVAVFGPSSSNVIGALTIVYFPLVARIMRSSALVVREQTYIEALKAMGASSSRIIWLHIAPNALNPLIVQATFIFAMAIISEAALSFLGVGVPPPQPSLGNILFDGKNVIFNAWWITAFSGTVLMLIVLGLNMFGDGLRDILDPKSNK